jgi:hypothetical protein
MKKDTANRPECWLCVSNRGGECITLESTGWMKNYEECPFLITKEKFEADQALLRKAIEEGRVDPKYG